MNGFRLFLLTFLVVLIVYTLIVVSNHGMNLFAVFFGDMMAMNWPGQFNLDFLGFLMLSALWVIWRNDFAPMSFVLGIFAFLGGMSFLPVYLVYLSYKTEGNIGQMILGERRHKGAVG